MKALQLISPGVIKLVDLDIPKATKGTVVLKVLYTALNRRDLWIVQGLYRKDHYKFPVTLGSDVCGEIFSVGEGVNQPEKLLNKKVIVNSCFNWGTNQNHSSSDINILGMPQDGTYAEYIRVPLEKIYDMPPHLTPMEAAAIPLAGLTAWRACKVVGQIKEGDNVLISGIGGGVSLTALMFGVGMKANVYVTSSSQRKIDIAIKLGAKGGALYTQKDWSRTLFKETKGKGFQCVIDGSVGPNSWNEYMKIMALGGRLCFYGATAGPPEQLDVFRAFLKQISIIGCTMGSDKDFEEMVEFINTQKLKPYIECIYPFQRIDEAIISMDKGKHFGKIIIDFSKNGQSVVSSKL